MECPFCSCDEKLLENKLAYIKKDKYPVNRGHFLVIPKKHITKIEKVDYSTVVAMFELVEIALDNLKTFRNAENFNIGINLGKYAGQTIEHLHIHIIPRHEGDVENPTGGIRGVIPDKQDYRSEQDGG